MFADPISTHILETSVGLPGHGIDVHLFKLLPGANWVFISSRFVWHIIYNSELIMISLRHNNYVFTEIQKKSNLLDEISGKPT